MYLRWVPRPQVLLHLDHRDTTQSTKNKKREKNVKQSKRLTFDDFFADFQMRLFSPYTIKANNFQVFYSILSY